MLIARLYMIIELGSLQGYTIIGFSKEPLYVFWAHKIFLLLEAHGLNLDS